MEATPAEMIERLVRERRDWSRERALAELTALARLAAVLAASLRAGAPGARWWSAQELGSLRDPRSVTSLFAALEDPVSDVGEAACDALVQYAADDRDVRARLRASLSHLATSGGPRAAASARTLAKLDAHELAEDAERRGLDAALASEPLHTIRTVRRCGIQFRLRCPRAWSALTPTEDPDVRHCDACTQPVFFCRTDAETIARAIAGDCVGARRD